MPVKVTLVSDLQGEIGINELDKKQRFTINDLYHAFRHGQLHRLEAETIGEVNKASSFKFAKWYKKQEFLLK